MLVTSGNSDSGPETRPRCLIEGEGLSGDQVTVVGLDDFSEQRDGSGDGLLQQESENTKHRQSTVVDFRDESSGLVLLTSVLAEVEGIVKLEGDGVGDCRSEFWEGTGFSASHVMGLVDIWVRHTGGQFAVDLQESDDSDDLVLRFDWKGGPLLRRGQFRAWEWASIESHGPRPVEVGLNAVSNEGSHGNTSVLDFGMSKESNGSFITLFPKVPGSETKRIPVFNGGIQIVRQGLEIGLCRLQLCGGGLGAGWGKGGGGCGGREKDAGGGLHGLTNCVVFECAS